MVDYGTSPSEPHLPPLGGRPSLGIDTRHHAERERMEAAPSTGDSSASLGTTFLALLFLILLGGFLRFWRLGQQAYWCDEAATLERICDSMDHLVDALKNQAFPPAWYMLSQQWLHLMQWWTGSKAAGFLPEYTRMLPAIFGTLTVPAMFLLARQFLNRRAALLVTLLATVNPYLIYYSRDIKMYAALWFFVTLHAALFFIWLSTNGWLKRNLILWPLLALTGVAMVNLHDMAWFIVALELLWLVTQPRVKGLDGPLWMLSVGVMAIAPIWWHLYRTQFFTTTNDHSLDWMQRYTDMSRHTIMSLPTSQLLGFLWPEQPVSARMKDWFDLGNSFHEIPWLATLQWWAGISLLSILFAGILPWRALGWSPNLWWKRISKGRWYWKASLLLPVVAGIYWTGLHIAPERRKKATRGRWWWVALWIALPTCALALTWVDDKMPLHIPFTSWTFTKLPLGRFHDIWEPRYLGILLPALLLWLGTALCRLPTRPLRAVAILGIVAVCVASSLTNHLTHRLAPFDVTAATVAKYIDKTHPDSSAYGVPWVEFAQNASLYPFVLAMDSPILPQFNSNDLEWLPEYKKLFGDVSDHLTDGTNGSYINFLKLKGSSKRIRVIILTDRLAGNPNDPISNDAVDKILGPEWERKEEQTVNWYYEWRFYVYHTWRTRVWVRIPPK